MTVTTGQHMVPAPRLDTHTAYAAALTGAPCEVVSMDDTSVLMPVWRWISDADDTDELLLRRCAGVTVDIGCGPGRMTRALLQRGVAALGIDVVAEAVRQTRDRGGLAIQRDVFAALPGEGRWDTALLADGNIGIGGDPVRLLRRVAQLLNDSGRVIVDLSSPGGPVRVHRIGLRVGGARTAPFPWAVVPADQIELLAEAAALRTLDVLEHQGRWFAELGKGNRHDAP